LAECLGVSTADPGRTVGSHLPFHGFGSVFVTILPVNLKRNHIRLAHTAGDIDQTLEAAEAVLNGRQGIA
jgi:hypothetical protein